MYFFISWSHISWQSIKSYSTREFVSCLWHVFFGGLFVDFHLAQLAGYNVGRKCFCKPVTSKVDICTKFGISFTHCMLISHLSQRRWRGRWWCCYKPTRLPNCRPEFESHHWIYLRTPGEISWGFSGNKARCFFWEPGDIPILFCAFKTCCFFRRAAEIFSRFMATKTSYCSSKVGPSPPVSVTTKTDILGQTMTLS